MAEKYVNNEKNIQILQLQTSIFQVFRKVVKLQQLTHCFILFFKFLKMRNVLIRTCTTTLPCFQRKLKNVQQDIVKQPANCINKTKRDIKKKINNSQNFIQGNYTDLLVLLAKIRYHERCSCIFWKNILMLLFLMVLCQIGMDRPKTSCWAPDSLVYDGILQLH